MTRYILRLVPERERWLPEFTAQIPHLEIVRDHGRDAFLTFLRALAQAGAAAAVHLEDDAQLTSGFVGKIEHEIAQRPTRLIQFFSRVKDDPARGSRERPAVSFYYNICFYLPAGYGAALYEYYPRWPRRRIARSGWYDTLIQDWLKERGERYWQHVPSLVQHRDLKSTIPGHGGQRQSATFVP